MLTEFVMLVKLLGLSTCTMCLRKASIQTGQANFCSKLCFGMCF